jgi:hypothetical protein
MMALNCRPSGRLAVDRQGVTATLMLQHGQAWVA